MNMRYIIEGRPVFGNKIKLMKSLIFDDNEVNSLGDDVMIKELLFIFSNDD